MKLEIHPQASQNYNKKAEYLVSRVSPAPEHLRQKSGLPNPNIHSVFNFTPENIIGEMEYGWTDFTGNVSAKAFGEGSQMIGLFGEDYTELSRVAEGMQKSITPRGVVSLWRLSDLLFKWVKDKYRGASIPTMTEYVLAECEKLIKNWKYGYLFHNYIFKRLLFLAKLRLEP